MKYEIFIKTRHYNLLSILFHFKTRWTTTAKSTSKWSKTCKWLLNIARKCRIRTSLNWSQWLWTSCRKIWSKLCLSIERRLTKRWMHCRKTLDRSRLATVSCNNNLSSHVAWWIRWLLIWSLILKSSKPSLNNKFRRKLRRNLTTYTSNWLL